jgi:2-polyprenyl-6-hydroxyphenyl methylase/3-demethylubiquinone-9 3-methyltransferase
MLILSTINRTIKSYAQTIIAAEYILKWMPINTHDYSKFLKPSELYKILEASNFQLKNLTGLKFDIITNTWYLSDDIDVNYFACVIKNSYPS